MSCLPCANHDCGLQESESSDRIFSLLESYQSAVIEAIEDLQKTVGQQYIDACILSKEVFVDGVVYYELQAHNIMGLFGAAFTGSVMGPIMPEVLINTKIHHPTSNR